MIDEFNTRPLEQYSTPKEVCTSGREINTISNEYPSSEAGYKTSSPKRRKTSRVTKMMLGTIMGTLTLTSIAGTAVDNNKSEPTEIVEEATDNMQEDWYEPVASVSGND